MNALPPGTTIRHPETADHARVQAVMENWWGGIGNKQSAHDRALLLPRLYFQHFTDSSYVIERDGELVAFLIGFLSQSRPDESYIHFVGVDPAARGTGVGRYLYQRFFDYSREHGRTVVRSITSPVNTGSQAFHASMGFTAAVVADYDSPGTDRVAFAKTL
ncbi:GNAT family N-acetyltransferase [Amycolatopsis sp.]|uniref:GNAT family N-acetyltransferase n=1 Tax=Amycolatopsis sp. TaxID=37632 RepID=UPI0026358EA0|nr:GNAT family N-acetyltransferase [Amycolatopsis sp.]